MAVVLNRDDRHQAFFAAVRQTDGVFTIRMASEYGLTEADIRSGVRTGAWHKFNGVYRLATASDGWRARLQVALLRGAAGLIGLGDFVFPEHMIVIEIDGRAWHSSPERFQSDRTRQNRLMDAGWRVYRFTWQDLTQTPAAVVHQIESAIFG